MIVVMMYDFDLILGRSNVRLFTLEKFHTMGEKELETLTHLKGKNNAKMDAKHIKMLKKG